MNIHEIIERNYNANVRRGKISKKTMLVDWLQAIQSEIDELKESTNVSKINPFDIKELADVVLVCHSMAKHYGYDLIKVMDEKTLYNEIRE